jgi:hypothetical protein
MRVDVLDMVEDIPKAFNCIQTLIQRGNFTSKASTELLLALIVRSLPKSLVLAALTEFCLVRLDNKYFKIH